MVKKFRWLVAVFLLLGGSAFAQDSISTVEKNFKDTPESQQLGIYWYWVAGNMSKEGVVKDLQAMKSVGINRAFIGMIGEGQGAPQGPVRMFTDEWWDILHTMFKTAGEPRHRDRYVQQSWMEPERRPLGRAIAGDEVSWLCE